MIKARWTARLLATCSSIGIAACGSNGGDGQSLESTATAQSAIATEGHAQESADRDKKERDGDDHCVAPGGVAALPGYSVRIWAQGTTEYSNPDSIEVDGNDVWVGFQNVTAKDGSDGKTSTVVEYDRHGHVERTFAVPGHCDGLRIDPSTHIVWASSNEDGNPALVSIDPATGVITPFTFAPTVHGGGYDDMAFLGGKMFIAASNPTLNAAGVNVFPALDEVTFSGTSANVSPVLLGNITATDLTTSSTVTLNEVDPDSITIDPAGDLVLDNQGGSELVFVHAPGAAGQVVSRIPLPTQVDDTVWATSNKGVLFLADATANTIYTIRTKFVVGTVYTETPNDSSVTGMLATIDLKTGFLAPQIIGFKKPTGLLFVAE